MPYYQCMYSHYKFKTVSWPPNHNNGNPYSQRTVFTFESTLHHINQKQYLTKEQNVLGLLFCRGYIISNRLTDMTHLPMFPRRTLYSPGCTGANDAILKDIGKLIRYQNTVQKMIIGVYRRFFFLLVSLIIGSQSSYEKSKHSHCVTFRNH